MSEEIKQEALGALQGLLDDLVQRVRSRFSTEGFATVVKQIDYVAQIVILEFADDAKQPDAATCDTVGSLLRSEWPDMPDARTALFRLANRKSKLIIDIGTAENTNVDNNVVCDGIVAEPLIRAAEYRADAFPGAAKTGHFPIVKYNLSDSKAVKQTAIVEVTPDALG